MARKTAKKMTRKATTAKPKVKAGGIAGFTISVPAKLAKSLAEKAGAKNTKATKTYAIKALSSAAG